MNPKVVVIGHGYTSRLSIIRSVGMAGYDVDVVVIYYGNKVPCEKPVDCYSKYVSKVLYSPSGNEEALVQLLLNTYKDCSPKPILVPESDYAVQTIDNQLSRLGYQFLVPNIDHKEGAVAAWLDKQKQKAQARSVGLTVADCTRITIKDGNYTIPEGVKYPCFPKPADGGKRGLGRCDTKEALDKTLRYMATIRDMDVLVEDFLSIDKEYALLGFSDGNEVVIPAILYNEQMAHGGHFGVAKRGQVLPIIGYESLVEKFKQLIRSIGFVGLFDIDFLECQGQFYFDEINFRFGGSGYAVTKAGANLPAMMADFFVGNRKTDAWHLTAPVSFVNERTCLDDWFYDFTSFKEYVNDTSHVDICFIKDEDDAAPYKAYVKYVKKMRIKHFIKCIMQ
jgi:predicted ATP-grasp superfamily ATP-dependent carboligase